MAKTTTQIKEIVALGGNVNIDATSKTTTQLKEIAAVAKRSNAAIIIRNADSKTTLQLKEIAHIAPGQITFIL